MRLVSKASIVLVVFAVGCFAAWGSGRLCPTDQGACFVDLQDGELAALFQSQDWDGDGDVDYIMIISDGFNDFNLVLPGGRTYIHTNDQRATLIYCPFNLFDAAGEMVMPTDDCVYGDGHASVSVWVGPSGLCPASLRVRGSGERMRDGLPFKFSGQLLVTGEGNCRTHTYEIVDDMP